MTPILKTNITQQVSEYLKENLKNNVWKPGEKIPSENELTKTLQVSRASVRMAIQQLIGIGILASEHGKGTFVISTMQDLQVITEDDCRDIAKVLEFRQIIEPQTCFLAVQNATSQTIETLSEHLEKMCRVVGNSLEFVRADIAFHEAIGKASGNNLLEKSLAEVFRQTEASHKQINELFGYKDGIFYHRSILDAFIEGDAEKAKKLMKKHIMKAARMLER